MRKILERRREEGTLRELRTPEQDQCFVDFTSNDYLGLGRSAQLGRATELEEARAHKVCIYSRNQLSYAVLVLCVLDYC